MESVYPAVGSTSLSESPTETLHCSMSEPKDLPAVTVAVFPQTGLNCVIKFVSQNIIISLDLSLTIICVCV